MLSEAETWDGRKLLREVHAYMVDNGPVPEAVRAASNPGMAMLKQQDRFTNPCGICGGSWPLFASVELDGQVICPTCHGSWGVDDISVLDQELALHSEGKSLFASIRPLQIRKDFLTSLP